ncbi:MAG: thiamine biosynthesis protein ThiJ [Betaproteobacteria bacterium]|jgi:putative intracellular protease/amidase|nr:thiamine biosynthesis protein ThiJ [Betaproteobacteria bacterium]
MLIKAHGESKGKIGVFIEEHFDMTEYRLFNRRFPAAGYDLEYMSNLWGNASLQFGSNPDNDWVEEHLIVTKDVKDVNPSDYKGFLLIGAYATDRLRYSVKPEKGKPNDAPAVELLRRINATPGVKIGTICHSLWLLCADRSLLEGRRVTCAHNIICDVENAGADVQYGDDGTVGSVVDGDLITAKHPAFTDELIDLFIQQIEA